MTTGQKDQPQPTGEGAAGDAVAAMADEGVQLIAAEARVRELEAERHAMVRVFLDGDSWCALVGPDLQEGTAGFGVTPAHALTELAENLIGNPWPVGGA